MDRMNGMGGVTGLAVPAAPKQAPVFESLDRLEQVLRQTQENFDRLASQINSVLEPVPTGGETPAPLTTSSCPLDSRIVAIVGLAAELGRQINHIRDRVRV